MNIKSVAQKTVEKFAPNEIPSFESFWEDLSGDIDINPGEREAEEFGFGGEAHIDVYSLIIIPLAVAIGKCLIEHTVDAAVAWIKSRLKRPDSVSPEEDRKLREMAQFILIEVERHRAK